MKIFIQGSAKEPKIFGHGRPRIFFQKKKSLIDPTRLIHVARFSQAGPVGSELKIVSNRAGSIWGKKNTYFVDFKYWFPYF